MTEPTTIQQGPCAGCRHPESAHVAGRVPAAPGRCQGDGTRACRCSGYDVTLLETSAIDGLRPSAYYAGRFRSGNEIHLGELGVATTACGRWTKYGLIVARGAAITCEQCLGARGTGLHGFGGSGRAHRWAQLLTQRAAPATPAPIAGASNEAEAFCEAIVDRRRCGALGVRQVGTIEGRAVTLDRCAVHAVILDAAPTAGGPRPPSFSENLEMADHAAAARRQLLHIEQTLTATLDADAYALLADAFAAVGALQSHLYDRMIAQNAAAAAAIRELDGNAHPAE